MPGDEQHREVWTYIGLRHGKGGAFDYAWRDPAGAVYLTKKRLRQVPVGGQIEITVTADDKVVTRGEGAPKPLLSRHEDDNDIAAWLAEDERAGNEKRLKAIEREAAKAVPLNEILTTIEDLTAHLNQPQRRALAALILQAVFGGTRSARR
jgi:hypothetical protein